MLKKIILIGLTAILISACSQTQNVNEIVNTNHLDYLYEEFTLDTNDMALVNIYSDYPEYKFVGDDDEGIACVDDAARAAIFYLNNYKLTKSEISLEKNKFLLNFVLYMQADDGYFYNFIWEDYSINKEHKNSLAEANWWSWRALWALSESYEIYKKIDYKYSEKILSSANKLIDKIKLFAPSEKKYEEINNIKYPTWLPNKWASDQAALLLIALTEYYKERPDKDIYNYMEMLADGIVEMQIKDSDHPYYGAFLSWENIWHAWGNSQSDALLKFYQIKKNEKYLTSALIELDNFYKYLYDVKFLESFTYQDTISTAEKKYSQIAYGIRPMVFSLLEAYNITKDDKYAKSAGEIANWFNGYNLANVTMYNHRNGIVFDGINDINTMNKNSGAESTIEGLLTIQKVKSIEISKNIFLSNKK